MQKNKNLKYIAISLMHWKWVNKGPWKSDKVCWQGHDHKQEQRSSQVNTSLPWKPGIPISVVKFLRAKLFDISSFTEMLSIKAYFNES